MVSQDLVLGQKYKFIIGFEVLKYLGKEGSWYQFEKLGVQGVWCEVLGSDLHLIEGVD